MADDWHERYGAASKEYLEAETEYEIAEKAMARAVFRRNSAERNLNRIYRERIDLINGAVGGEKL